MSEYTCYKDEFEEKNIKHNERIGKMYKVDNHKESTVKEEGAYETHKTPKDKE